jgi:hypothetical protein
MMPYECYFSVPSPASNLSHKKTLLWDTNGRAHTAHRIICGLLLVSALASYCFPGAPLGQLFENQWLDGLASVFYRPHLFLDLLYANYAVHPALVEINRIIPRLHDRSIISTGYKTLDFWIGVVLLVFVIGGGSNLLASRVTGSRVYGFSSVSAASLAYYQRITLVRRPILFFLWNQPVTAATAYWSSVAILVVRQNRDWFPPLLAWLSAGWAGSMLAKYHLENMMIFGDILKIFGMT